MYARRNKMDPLWNGLVVGGFRDGKGFLGLVDMYGTTYEDDTVATGYGAHIARPLLRTAVEAVPGGLSEAQAVKLLEDNMRILYYRDARACSRVRCFAPCVVCLTFLTDPNRHCVRSRHKDWRTV
jgi:20S proteasome subunit beta 7